MSFLYFAGAIILLYLHHQTQNVLEYLYSEDEASDPPLELAFLG